MYISVFKFSIKKPIFFIFGFNMKKRLILLKKLKKIRNKKTKYFKKNISFSLTAVENR